MKKVLFGIFVVLFSLPAMAVLVTGKVVDNQGALFGIDVSVEDNSRASTVTAEDGSFSLEVPDLYKDSQLVFSGVAYGLEIQKLPIKQQMGTIKMQADKSNTLDASVVTECDKDSLKKLNATAGEWSSERNRCVPTACKTPRYNLEFADTDMAYCADQVGMPCFDCDLGADSCEYVMDKGRFVCKVMTCLSEDEKVENNSCVSRVGEDCTKDAKKTDKNVETAELDTNFVSGEMFCRITKCKNGYKVNDDETKCIEMLKECTEDQYKALKAAGASKTGIKKGTETCIALECACGYDLKDEECVLKTDKVCTKYTKPALPNNAKSATMACINDKAVCIIDDNGCIDGYNLDKPNNKCMKLKGTSCTVPGDDNYVVRAIWESVNGQLKCIIKKCEQNYKPNDAGTQCIKTGGECSPDDEYADGPGTLKKGKCIPNACKSGYRVVSGKCMVTKCKCGEREKDNKCVKLSGDDLKCTPFTSTSAPANAEYGKITCPKGDAGKEMCQIDEKSCKAGYRADVANNRCLSEQGMPCNDEAKKMDSNATLGEYQVLVDGTKQCKIEKCVENWKPNTDKTKCIRVSGPCPEGDLAEIEYATAGEWKNGKCIATECKDGYKPNKTGKCVANPCGCKEKLVDNKCVPKAGDELKCSYTTLPRLHENAAAGELACNAKGKEYCMVLTCKDGFDKNADSTKCTSNKNDKCTFEGETKEYVKTARYRERNGSLACIITACTDGYMVDEKTNTCVVSEGPCSEAQVKAIQNATAGELRKGKCYPTQCDSGYEVSGSGCVAISGSCKPIDKNATSGMRKFDSGSNTEICVVTGCVGGYDPSEDGTECVENADEQKKIADAQAEYDAAKENEQSLANRMLGATAMGTMGIGGMMVGQALSEQKADKDAELDMTAYLATFRCDYGAGRSIKGGETNIELPGASELIPLYSEYVALANDLKLRKAQLGLKSGIESEKILDSATTGLYDDVGVGITSGAYASLSRALQDPDGADAKMWAEQKDKTAQNLKTGAITAGVGAAVGIVGNAINKGIIKKQEKQKLAAARKLEEDIAKIKPVTAACPSQATGTYPNCVCNSNKEYNRNANECRECTGGRVSQIIDGKQQCVCSSDNQIFDATQEKCVNKNTVPECDTEEGEQLQNGECVVVTPDPEQEEYATDESFDVVLPVGALFDLGKSTLRSDAKKSLDTFVANLIDGGISKCSDFSVSGYADPTGGKDRNQTLSKQRANAVHNYLMAKTDFKNLLGGVSTGVIGYGEAHCTCGVLSGGVPEDKKADSDYKYCVNKPDTAVVPDSTPFAPCRRVKISMKCEMSSTMQSVMDSLSSSSSGLMSGIAGGLSAGDIKLN